MKKIHNYIYEKDLYISDRHMVQLYKDPSGHKFVIKTYLKDKFSSPLYKKLCKINCNNLVIPKRLKRNVFITPYMHALNSPDMSITLSVKDIYKMIGDITTAVMTLNKNNISHGDINPNNIYLSDCGDYLLGDFSESRIMTTDNKNNLLKKDADDIQSLLYALLNNLCYEKEKRYYDPSLMKIFAPILNDKLCCAGEIYYELSNINLSLLSASEYETDVLKKKKEFFKTTTESISPGNDVIFRKAYVIICGLVLVTFGIYTLTTFNHPSSSGKTVNKKGWFHTASSPPTISTSAHTATPSSPPPQEVETPVVFNISENTEQILDIAGEGLSDIVSGLEYADDELFEKKTILFGENNNFTDISEISAFYNIETVVLSHNKIKDLSVLSKLKKLKVLILSDNLITDISPLKSMSTLIYLDLSGNKTLDSASDIDELLNNNKMLNTLILSDTGMIKSDIKNTTSKANIII